MQTTVNGLPRCNKCGNHNLVVEKLPSQVDGKELSVFFVLCKGPEGCGTPDGKGCRPLTNGMPSQFEAEKQWREEAGRHPYKEPA